jgi:hypothetical protein
MYAGYAWLTNTVGPNGLRHPDPDAHRDWRLLRDGAQHPRAESVDGLPFGVAFAIVTIVHAALFTKATNSSAIAIFRIAPYNFLAAACTIGAAWLDPAWRWTGWLAAVLVFVVATLRRREGGFRIRARTLPSGTAW